ncbi:hypothetical protein FACS1894151_06010 [Spirochaetia bacterium]|nr:hypothetical protein FACS1894151_06010 [Spirochaetia bacterium]
MGALLSIMFISCVSQNAVTAEEYYSLGMAYFNLKNYAEAEKWLGRAVAVDKTKAASEYQLGRIAFETGRYEDALYYFELVLHRDAVNVLALQAAAYTCIRLDRMESAESYYNRTLVLVPESADNGYNHALVLLAMGKAEEAETVLQRYPYALEEKGDALLLLARIRRARNRGEAIDNYADWLDQPNHSDNRVSLEYALVLEQNELYARALEVYQTLINSLQASDIIIVDGKEYRNFTVRFLKARLLFIADPENEEGLTEFENAITAGFADLDALRELAADQRLSKRGRETVQASLDALEV